MKQSAWVALRILAGASAVFIGYRVRQHADFGQIVASNTNAPLSGLLASRSNDVNVPAGDYFYELSQKLKQEYVESVSDDQKLASGAIRGMIGSLDDTESMYMDKDEFAAFLNARTGKYEGIGADLELVRTTKSKPAQPGTMPTDSEMTPEDAMVVVKEIPRVQVVSLVPGGPADKAGVKVGDVVAYVDDHWVVESSLINKFRAAMRKFTAKKLPIGELNIMRSEIRTKTEHAILPTKAKDKLFLGKAGSVKIVWLRAGKEITTNIEKAPSRMPAFSVTGNTILLPMAEGDASKLREAVKGKSEVTLDLRNNTMAATQSMKECLAAIAPDGNYGYFVTRRQDTPTALAVAKGNEHPPKINLLVDKSTRGMAEVFALALAHKGLAKVDGKSMGGDVDSKQIVQLPDGSGYTLATSTYQTQAIRSKAVALKGGVR